MRLGLVVVGAVVVSVGEVESRRVTEWPTNFKRRDVTILARALVIGSAAIGWRYALSLPPKDKRQ